MSKSLINPSIKASEISETKYPLLEEKCESLVNEISSEVAEYAYSRGNSLLKSILGMAYFIVLVYFTAILITG